LLPQSGRFQSRLNFSLKSAGRRQTAHAIALDYSQHMIPKAIRVSAFLREAGMIV